MLRKSVAALAAISFIAAPLAAPAAAAPVDSIARAGAATEGASRLGGGPIIPPVLAATIILLGVLMATGVIFDNDDSTPLVPVSP